MIDNSAVILFIAAWKICSKCAYTSNWFLVQQQQRGIFKSKSFWCLHLRGEICSLQPEAKHCRVFLFGWFFLLTTKGMSCKAEWDSCLYPPFISLAINTHLGLEKPMFSSLLLQVRISVACHKWSPGSQQGKRKHQTYVH